MSGIITQTKCMLSGIWLWLLRKLKGRKLIWFFAWGDLQPYYKNNSTGWVRVVGDFDLGTKKLTVELKQPIVFIPGKATLWIELDGTMSVYRNKVVSEASEYKGKLTKK